MPCPHLELPQVSQIPGPIPPSKQPQHLWRREHIKKCISALILFGYRNGSFRPRIDSFRDKPSLNVPPCTVWTVPEVGSIHIWCPPLMPGRTASLLPPPPEGDQTVATITHHSGKLMYTLKPSHSSVSSVPWAAGSMSVHLASMG